MTQYTLISDGEFESFLDNLCVYEEVDDGNANERVFELPLPPDDLSIRVFSTLESGASRGRGEDAIRTVVWSDDGPIGGRSKTLRIGPTASNPDGWKANLRGKIEDLYANWRDYNKTCECGSRMTVRDGEYGRFWGCTEYPTCRNTEEY